ncbi:MAG: acyl-CoA dehydrogenase family protein [Byssovorax sp.]
MILSPLEIPRSLEADIRAASAETERGRRLLPTLAAKMAEAGLFRLCVPGDLGGLEASPRAAIEVLEEVAKADGAAGWCLMVAITSSLVAGYLDQATAREIFGNPGAIVSGVFAPRGAASVVPGGYRVTGRWPFASGCQHATWLLGGAVLFDEGALRKSATGVPESRLMIFPAADVTIHDTWNVLGLAGTGSHDIEVDDVFVPAARSVSFFTDPRTRAGALYDFPAFGFLALGVAAVALGIAQRASDDFRGLATEKTPFGGKRPLAARPAIQAQLAEIEALLRSARAFLHDAIDRGIQATVRGGGVPIAERVAMRLAACHATTSAARAVDIAYAAAGGSSIYASSPLQRSFRDVHVATQHVMVGPVIQELCGKVLAGIEADTSML